MTKIIEARVSEIFEEVQKKLKEISKQNLLPAGIVLTGGGANLPGLVDFAKKSLKLPCRTGRPFGLLELDDDPSFATVSGLVLRGAELEGEKGDWGGMRDSLVSGVGGRIKKILKVFIP